MCNIPIKKTIKYLGIHILKTVKEKQENDFKLKIQKTKNILKCGCNVPLKLFLVSFPVLL